MAVPTASAFQGSAAMTQSDPTSNILLGLGEMDGFAGDGGGTGAAAPSQSTDPSKGVLMQTSKEEPSIMASQQNVQEPLLQTEPGVPTMAATAAQPAPAPAPVAAYQYNPLVANPTVAPAPTTISAPTAAIPVQTVLPAAQTTPQTVSVQAYPGGPMTITAPLVSPPHVQQQNPASVSPTGEDPDTKPKKKRGIPHVYHDYSAVPDSIGFVRKKTGGVTCPFPEKLHEMLGKELDNQEIVGWLPHGRAFIVRKPKAFTEQIMPKYFRQSKLTSFQRQLNLYGFRRITQGADSGAYYHELFLRGRPQLCMRMNRQKVKGTGHKQPSDTSTEPNFYNMPHQPQYVQPVATSGIQGLAGAANLIQGFTTGIPASNLGATTWPTVAQIGQQVYQVPAQTWTYVTQPGGVQTQVMAQAPALGAPGLAPASVLPPGSSPAPIMTTQAVMAPAGQQVAGQTIYNAPMVAAPAPLTMSVAASAASAPAPIMAPAHAPQAVPAPAPLPLSYAPVPAYAPAPTTMLPSPVPTPTTTTTLQQAAVPAPAAAMVQPPSQAAPAPAAATMAQAPSPAPQGTTVLAAPAPAHAVAMPSPTPVANMAYAPAPQPTPAGAPMVSAWQGMAPAPATNGNIWYQAPAPGGAVAHQ